MTGSTRTLETIFWNLFKLLMILLQAFWYTAHILCRVIIVKEKYQMAKAGQDCSIGNTSLSDLNPVLKRQGMSSQEETQRRTREKACAMLSVMGRNLSLLMIVPFKYVSIDGSLPSFSAFHLLNTISRGIASLCLSLPGTHLE